MGQPEPLKTPNSLLTTATVQTTDGERVLVAGTVGLVQAMRAASCLLAPRPRDTVLLALLDDGSAWVVAVLRTQTDQAELRLPSETELATRSLTIRSERFSVEGNELCLTARLVSLGGQILWQGFSVIQTLARSLGQRVGRCVSRFGSVDEDVAGLRKTKAHRVQETISTSYRLRAENADIKASGQVDIDANHIKIG